MGEKQMPARRRAATIRHPTAMMNARAIQTATTVGASIKALRNFMDIP
ncbi:MAG: hypothetical protein KGL39_45140 [Patescibacteria group bacterium]|nr:hypothetical protein [Patescibacteria group bacterium]